MFFKKKKEPPKEAPCEEKTSLKKEQAHHFSHERTLTAEGWQRKLKEKNSSKK